MIYGGLHGGGVTQAGRGGGTGPKIRILPSNLCLPMRIPPPDQSTSPKSEGAPVSDSSVKMPDTVFLSIIERPTKDT